MSNNPILEGIMAGAGLAQRSAQMRQDKFNDRVKADQFDRSHKLDRDMFKEQTRITKRNENMQAAQAWRSKLHSMQKKFNTLEGDKKEMYGATMLNHFNDGLQNNAYIKEILGEGFQKLTGRGANEVDNGNELNMLTARPDGEGDADIALTNKQGGFAAESVGGMPLTMKTGELMEFMDGTFNDAFKASNVELDRQDARTDKLSKGLESFDTNYVQTNAGVRDAQSAWGQHQEGKPGLAGGAADPQNPQAPQALQTKNPEGEVWEPTLQGADAGRMDEISKKILVLEEEKRKALNQNDKYHIQSRIDGLKEEAGVREKRRDEGSGKVPATVPHGLGAGKNSIEAKVTKGQVAPEDVKDPKKAQAAWAAKDKELEVAYNNARTAADKAEVARSRAHIAAMQKMGIKMDAGDISNIMNHQDANYHYNMRNQLLARRNQTKSREDLNKLRDKNRKGVIDHYKFYNSNVEQKYRAGGWPEKALGAIKKSQIMNNPYTDFTEDDAAAVDPMFKKLAPYTDDLSYDTAIIATDLTSGGFLKDLEGEDFYNRVDGFATSFQGISDRINEDPRGRASARSVTAHIMQIVKAAKEDPKNKGVGDAELMVNAINAYNG